MIHRIAAFGMVALVAGCEGDLGTKDSADTGTTDCEYTGAVVIAEANISCVDDNTVLFEMRTDGIASDGLIFSQETGNADDPYAQYSDEHTLAVVDSDADCGTYTDLERQLETGVALADITTDVNTLFRCDENAGGDPYHHNAEVMTYAFRAYDSAGALADCVIAGDDPSGLQDGDYNRLNDPADAAEIASCALEGLTY